MGVDSRNHPFARGVTKETIRLPLGCLQGGFLLPQAWSATASRWAPQTSLTQYIYHLVLESQPSHKTAT